LNETPLKSGRQPIATFKEFRANLEKCVDQKVETRKVFSLKVKLRNFLMFWGKSKAFGVEWVGTHWFKEILKDQ
jgi:hypothetical protein